MPMIPSHAEWEAFWTGPKGVIATQQEKGKPEACWKIQDIFVGMVNR